MDYVTELLSKYPLIRLNSECINSLEKDITSQLMNLAQKTLVWDIHSKLKELTPHSLNDIELFNYYLTHRFGSNLTEYFFLEYPTLARLLAERILFAINNLRFFFDSLVDSSHDLESVFNIKKPFRITKFQTSKSDYHNKGKSTIILEINHFALVYKYHNNDVLKNYNTILSFIEKNNKDFSLYKSKNIIKQEYSIEEYISNEGCNDNDEIIEYYNNYGYLTALTYWLGATDLHKDNLIAKGKYPVLIDVETLLGNEERRTYSKDFSKIKYFESNSVISTGMLPMAKYWKKQLDYSALNGIKQKLPYKVRKLLNADSSKIGYELCDSYMLPANNIPKLNNSRITYENYSQYIESSFEKMLLWLQKNGNKLYQQILKHFNHTRIRVVLRDTQDYYNFLDFSTHPSCMIDYIEREKIFENLWSNSFIDSKVAQYEVAALCRHDIPYFYTEANSKNIYSCDGKIDNFFSTNILTVLKKHFTSLTAYNIEYSVLLLGESLDNLFYKYKPIKFSFSKTCENIFIDKAIKIAEIIFQNIIISDKYNQILWPELMNHGDKISIDYPDSNFYNGTSGLFVFFYHLNELYPDSKFKKLLHILEQEIFTANNFADYESAFYGNSSKITAAFVVYHYKKEKKYYNYMVKSLLKLKKIACDIKSWDWIRGKSSLLALLVTIYEECHIPVIEEILESLTINIDSINATEIGFAHGYSGILYALLRTNKILKKKNIKDKIFEIYHELINLIAHCNLVSPAWCNGTLGINRALLEFYDSFLDTNIELIQPTEYYKHNNSCICHGSFCEILAKHTAPKNNCSSNYTYIKELEKFAKCDIFLCQHKRFIPLGLFNGLSGIGYQLLRCASPNKILDILFFENISCF